MKKISLLFLLISCVITLSAQNYKMVIKTTDGTSQTYESADVEKTMIITDEIEVRPTYLELNRSKNHAEIEITCLDEWVVSTDVDWIVLSRTTGKGVAKIGVTVIDGTSSETDMYGVITVSTMSHTQKVTVVYSPSCWISLGIGKFADYGWMDNAPYEVEYQQDESNPTHFRIVEPFTAAYKNEGWTGAKPGAYLNFRILKPGDDVNGVEITQENLIYFEPCVTGYYVSDHSATLILYHPGDFTIISKESVSEAHFVYNKVMEYQKNGLPATVAIAPMYYMQGVGSYAYWNTQYVELTFPGVVRHDYEVSLTYTDQYTDKYGNKYACAEVRLGSDIAKAYYAVGKGKDASSLLKAIMAGEVECGSITESSEIMAAMPEDAKTGDYTIMVVGYDSEGEVQQYDYESFKYTSGDETESWTPAYVGTFTYSVFFGSEEEPQEDTGLVLSVSDKNENRFKISHIFNDVDFVFEMDPETGNLSYDDHFTGYTHSSYGDVYVGEVSKYSSKYADYVGYYKDGTFVFYNVYFVEAGAFGMGAETFTLTDKADTQIKSARKLKCDGSTKLQLSIDSELRPIFFPISSNNLVISKPQKQLLINNNIALHELNK